MTFEYEESAVRKPVISRRLKANILVVTLTFTSCYFFVFPVADDAIRAYSAGHEANRMRLFKFYVTARFYGFPYAMEKYGTQEE